VTAAALAGRVLPLRLGSRRALYLVERNLYVYRQVWVIIISGFFEPLFYLLSISVGIARLVGDVVGPDGTPVSYAAFAAPALLAASAMNGAVLESTVNIFFKLKYGKIYDAVLATPVTPDDVAVGEITWSLMRGGIYAVGFLAVMAVMGLVESPWGILALPAALLIGFAFASVGMACSTFMRTWQDLDLVTLVTLPLFLFSATFFPLGIYPTWLQVVARFSPLYHGVELIRGLTLGVFDITMVGHTAFLLAMELFGLAIAGRRISKLLLT